MTTSSRVPTAARPRLVTVAGQPPSAGISMDLAYGGKGVKGAVKVVDRSGARYAIVLGECDPTEDAARLKHLGSGEQRAVPLAAVAAVTREALGR